MPHARLRGAVTSVTLAVTIAACQPTRPVTPRATFADEELLDVYGPCHPPTASATAPRGATLPEGTIVTKVTRDPPLTEIRGFVRMTPVQVREYLEGRDDLIVIQTEDEIIESELLVSSGDHRTYVKATAVCVDGSSIRAFVAPADDAAAIPKPTGTPR